VQKAVQAVVPGGSGKEHEWALAGHYIDALFLAELHGFGGNGSASAGPVEPDSLYAGGGAFLYDRVGYGWSGHEQNRVDGRLDVAQVVKAGLAIDFVRRGVDGDGVVAACEEFTEEGAGEVLRLAGDADDGESRLGEEVPDAFDYSHEDLQILFYCP